MENKKLLTVEEMAEYLAIGRATAYSIVKQIGFPKVLVSKRIIRIPVDALELWLQRNMS